MIKILLNDQYEFEDENEINNFMKLLLQLCNALDDNFILMNNDAESDAVFLQSLSGDDIKISLDGKTVTSLNDCKTVYIYIYYIYSMLLLIIHVMKVNTLGHLRVSIVVKVMK